MITLRGARKKARRLCGNPKGKAKDKIIAIVSNPEIRAKAVATRRRNGRMPVHNKNGKFCSRQDLDFSTGEADE